MKKKGMEVGELRSLPETKMASNFGLHEYSRSGLWSGLRGSFQVSLKVFVGASLLLSVACTKSRDTKLADDIDPKNQTAAFAIADLLAQELVLAAAPVENESQSESQKQTQDLASKEKAQLAAQQEKGLSVVNDATVPSPYKFMFKKVQLLGQDLEVKVVFEVTQDKVTGYKVISDPQKVSALERQLARTIRGNVLAVPIFKIPVVKWGRLVREKDDDGHTTNKLIIQEVASFDQADHVALSIRAADVEVVRLAPSPETEKDNILVASKLNGQILTLKTMKDVYNLDVTLLSVEDPEAKFLVKLDSEGLHFFLITDKKSKYLSAEEKRAIEIGKNHPDLQECTKEIQGDSANCILALRGEVEVTFVEPYFSPTDSKEDEKSEFSFRAVRAGEKSELVKLSSGAAVKPSDDSLFRGLTPMTAIIGHKFAMRRVVEDVSNNFVIPLGFSGPTNIVELIPKSGSMVVRRVDNLLAAGINQSVDQEELMSLAASYYILKKRDADGSILPVPRLIAVQPQQAEVVKIHWLKNSLPISNSPLDQLGYGQCFDVVKKEMSAESLRDELSERGFLGFTQEMSVSVKAMECLTNSSALNGYAIDDLVQTVHNIRERISLLLVESANPEKENRPLRKGLLEPINDLPYYAQKALGFGAFTIANKRYDQFLNYGSKDTTESRMVLNDFREGRKMVYVLGGLSDHNPRRAQIIESTKEVFADWNRAFREAFAGTPLERSSDYVEILVDGDDIEMGNLGDLDRNYIWYVERAFDAGLLGVAQMAPHPKSGVDIAANVVMYGGGFENQLGHFQRVAQARADAKKMHRQAIALETQRLRAAETVLAIQLSAPGAPTAGVAAAAKMQTDQKDQADGQRLEVPPLASSEVLSLNWQESLSAASLKKLARSSDDLAHLALGDKVKKEKLYKKIAAKGYGHILTRLMENIKDQDAWSDSLKLEALSVEAILADPESKLSPQDKKSLTQTLAKKRSMLSLRENMLSSSPACWTPQQLPEGSFFTELDSLFVNSYKQTLAHELGHVFGLTHNFISSADPENFGDKDYASVMDYTDESLYAYKGLGNYDVFAIRAMYAGILQKADGSLASVADAKKQLKLDHWLDIRTKSNLEIKKAGFQAFRYCNDRDVGDDPLCAQFDFGATPSEIVKNMIADRDVSYYVSNSAKDKESFGQAGLGSYISRLFLKMGAIRSYLDGLFIHLIRRDISEPELIEYAIASYEGMQHLTAVVRTADSNRDVYDLKRLQVIPLPRPEPGKLDGQGRPKPEETYQQELQDYRSENEMLAAEGRLLNLNTPQFKGLHALTVVEAKSTYDIIPNVREDQILTRGVGFDKAIAMLLLTDRSAIGGAQESLPVSYMEMEALLRGGPVAENSIIVQTLADVLKDDVQALQMDPILGRVSLGTDRFTSTVTRLMTDLAKSVAIIGLAPNGIDGISGVNSFLFRVGSSLNGSHTQGEAFVNSLKERMGSPNVPHYFITDGAGLTNPIIQDLFMQRLFFDLNPTVSSSLQTAFDLADATIHELVALGLDSEMITASVANIAAAKISPSAERLQIQLKDLAQQMVPMMVAIGIDASTAPSAAAYYSEKMVTLGSFERYSLAKLLSRQISAGANKGEVAEILAAVAERKANQLAILKRIPFMVTMQVAISENLTPTASSQLAELVTLAETRQILVGLGEKVLRQKLGAEGKLPEQIEQILNSMSLTELANIGRDNLSEAQLKGLERQRQLKSKLMTEQLPDFVSDGVLVLEDQKNKWEQQFEIVREMSQLFRLVNGN